jgi:hypothetical protein
VSASAIRYCGFKFSTSIGLSFSLLVADDGDFGSKSRRQRPSRRSGCQLGGTRDPLNAGVEIFPPRSSIRYRTPMIARLTRQELHSLVWERPITKLAAEFGLSDVALHKICRKFRVPTPPVGFWAKKAHGKPTKITPLPNPEDRAEILVRESTASNEPEPIAEARAALLASLSTAWHGISSNPILERTLGKLRKAKAARDGLVRSEGSGLLRVAVRPEALDRAAAFLEKLVSDGERARLSLVKSDQGAAWSCDGETIAFELVEAADRVEHVATEQELAAVAKWKREREEYHRRYGYWRDWGEPKIPKWEQRYQGRLAIKLEEVGIKTDRSYWRGDLIRGTFAETRTRDLTRSVPAILSTVAAMAAAKQHNREFDKRRKAAEAEAARRRAAIERRRRMDEKASALLDQLAGERTRLEQLRSLVDLLKASEPTLKERGKRLLDWAGARVASLEAHLGADQLEQRLAVAELFGSDEPE